ncbi:MAG: galactonate dehydratase [Deltaproteobacteria bacterium]|nr:galactonate dehydratase [Deltaproteobacteria bacterium]
MKITEIKTFPFRCGWRVWLFLKVYTDEGISGLGEAGLAVYERSVSDIIHDLEEYLVGKDPRQIELHWNTIYRDSYWQPSVTLISALGGIEMALWDILGKSLNVPVYTLLGGACHPRIKVYNNAWYLSARSLEDFANLAQQAVAQGFRHLKWDPFWGYDIFIDGGQMRRAKECVRIVREAVGDEVELLIEMHGRFSPDTAIKVARELEEYNPYWIEEPIPPNCTVDALAKVAASTRIPVASGERISTRWGYWDVLNRQAVSVIQPDIICCGGILETKKIAAMAQVHYIGVAPHSASGPALAAASIHLDACTPNFLIQELFYPDQAAYGEILKEHFLVPKDGFIELPKSPGLGLELDEEAVSRQPFKYRRGTTLSGLWGDMEAFGK